MSPAVPYQVRLLIDGELGPRWSGVFGGLAVDDQADGTTLVTGQLPDQAALHGLLAAIRDLGLTLVSIETAPAGGFAPRRRSAEPAQKTSDS